MPSTSLTFRCEAPAVAVLPILQDIDFLAASIPGVEKVERVDDRTALWTVRLKMGPFERLSVYRGELVEAGPSSTEFRAVGPEAIVHGKISITDSPPSSSEVRVALDAQGQGALKAIIDGVLTRRLAEDASGLARKLQDRVHATLKSSGPA